MFNIRDLVTNNIECHNALMQFVESGNCGKLHIFQSENYRLVVCVIKFESTQTLTRN